MTLDIRQLLSKGHAALAADHAKKEEAQKGHPRVGSIGIVADDGEVYGVCHRKAHARQIGIEIPHDFHTDIMFKAGEGNETHWERILGKAGCDLMDGDEVAIKHKIDGVPLAVLGHPDVVLRDPAGNPFMGLELKGIFGYTTAVGVYLENTPKNENLIQSAGYAYMKGLPYALCYTSNSYVQLNFYDKKKYIGLKSIPPFYRIFYMQWRDKVLYYRDEFQAEWVKTNITPQAIEDYYRLLEEMKQQRDLGPRVNSNYVNGKEDKWGPNGACGLCELRSACDRYDGDKDYDQWVATGHELKAAKE